MKIAVVSKANAAGGGASRVAEDQAGWLIDAGHEVTHFCGAIIGTALSYQRPLFPDRGLGKVLRAVDLKIRNQGLCDGTGFEYTWLFRDLANRFEVVHFHDHYRTFSMRAIAKLSEHLPVVFTAHDCLHFTGGCLYPMGCDRFAQRCGQCPQKRSVGRFDFTRLNLKRNQAAAAGARLSWIYPSKWLANLSATSIDHRNACYRIPYGFDPAPYRFQTRIDARRSLGLPLDRRILCISAHYLSDRRKGTDFAIRAAASVHDLDPLVLLVGHPTGGVSEALGQTPFWFSGYVSSRERLGLLYAAADAFLFCPLEDNLPISVQESMAAATPVVGFATGGVAEMVINGETGWLVPTGDQTALNTSLRAALTGKQLEATGQLARKRLLDTFDKATCVSRLEATYNDTRDRIRRAGT